MNEIIETIAAVERRAHRVRAFRVAAMCFSLALAPILVAFLLERGRMAVISHGAWLALSVLPAIVLIASFLVVRRMPVNTPRVLLRVDSKLEMEERLSSLYEIYERNQAGPYREMLETWLLGRRLSWKRALPLGHTALLIPIGLALLVAVLVTSSLFPISSNLPAPTSGQVTSSADGGAQSIAASSRSERSETQSQISPSASGTSALSDSDTQPQHDLQDVLGKLWSSPSSPGVISSDQEGLDQLISQQRQAAKRLKELISQIQKRLADGGGGLTPEEKSALSSLAEQIGNESLRQALRGLAKEEDSEELQKRLQQTQKLAQSLQEEGSGPPAQAMTNEPSDSSQHDESDGLAYSTPMAGSPDEGGNHDSTGGGAPSAGNTTHDTNADRLQEGDDPFGGAGSGSASAPPTSATPQFTRREIVGSMGSAGDFKEFVTKGVPVEEAPSNEGAPSILRVDYDRLRALLSGRTLSPEVEDVVRRYFDDITQGGE
ncbi:hypothetical protein J7K60_01615 [Candidatus Bipolaricaulota bacterium]|nr:hypothetical protein [Candidatus Bipolaricaulota bacterium]